MIYILQVIIYLHVVLPMIRDTRYALIRELFPSVILAFVCSEHQLGLCDRRSIVFQEISRVRFHCQRRKLVWRPGRYCGWWVWVVGGE